MTLGLVLTVFWLWTMTTPQSTGIRSLYIVTPGAPFVLARTCCPVCSFSDIKDHFAFDGLRTAVGRACDFMFRRDIMAADALRDSYDEGYTD